jgi:hypothetical protein
MVSFPLVQRLSGLRVARSAFAQASTHLNEMNPNQTKDFDLRQVDSVVYQRSQWV